MRLRFPTMFCLLASMTQVWAQQPDAQPTTVATPPFAKTVKKMVTFITVRYELEGVVSEEEGTGFFVVVRDQRLGPDRGIPYLVTNRHVADPSVKIKKPIKVLSTKLRLNLKTPVNGSSLVTVDQPTNWKFSLDPSVDLAITQVGLPISDQLMDISAISDQEFALKSVVEAEKISEGDRVLFSGLFYQFAGQQRVEPIVRQGIIAMMPDDTVPTSLDERGRLYLADMHVFQGNSGSPVFVDMSGFRNGVMNVGGGRYLLLGVISGFFKEDADFQLQVASKVSGKSEINSGICMIVPVDELYALLHRIDVTADRDRTVKNIVLSMRPRQSPPAIPPTKP